MLQPKQLIQSVDDDLPLRSLRSGFNGRTLEKWEQGRAKPNPQAAALVLLVCRYPDTLERLEKLAAGNGAIGIRKQIEI